MPKVDLSSYSTEGFFDEMIIDKKEIRNHYALFRERIKKWVGNFKCFLNYVST